MHTLEDLYKKFDIEEKSAERQTPNERIDSLEWDTTIVRELLAQIRTWIREGKLKSGIPFPDRLDYFAYSHRRDITVYLEYRQTEWMVHWNERFATPFRTMPLDSPDCWHAVQQISVETIAWYIWQFARENGWQPMTSDFDISGPLEG